MIEAAGGVDVEAFSMVGDEEAEVLLFPGTKLEVVDVAMMGDGPLFQVHLKEVVTPMALFK